MAHSMSEVVFNISTMNKEDWDDTALIKAYDKAVGSYKEDSTAQKMNGFPESHGKRGKKKMKWNIGDYCQATYSVDNLPYEAQILEIYDEDKTCVVQFLGYDTEELISLESLQPSKGKHVRIKQLESANNLNWAAGDQCLALYSEDGLFYEAEILEIYPEFKSCLVRFVGYENDEEVSLKDLQPLQADPPSFDHKSEENNIKNSSVDESSSTFSSESFLSDAAHKGASNSHSSSHSKGCPHHHHFQRPHHRFASQSRLPINPPNSTMPIPIGFDNHDQLGPVLMAWYMAGYQTGYYQGRTSRAAQDTNATRSVPNLRHLR